MLSRYVIYYSAIALEFFEFLTWVGMDEDLACALIEFLLPEALCWDIPK